MELGQSFWYPKSRSITSIIMRGQRWIGFGSPMYLLLEVLKSMMADELVCYHLSSPPSNHELMRKVRSTGKPPLPMLVYPCKCSANVSNGGSEIGLHVPEQVMTDVQIMKKREPLKTSRLREDATISKLVYCQL